MAVRAGADDRSAQWVLACDPDGGRDLQFSRTGEGHARKAKRVELIYPPPIEKDRSAIKA